MIRPPTKPRPRPDRNRVPNLQLPDRPPIKRGAAPSLVILNLLCLRRIRRDVILIMPDNGVGFCSADGSFVGLEHQSAHFAVVSWERWFFYIIIVVSVIVVVVVIVIVIVAAAVVFVFC